MTQTAGNTPLPEFTPVVIGGFTHYRGHFSSLAQITFNSDDYWSGFYSLIYVYIGLSEKLLSKSDPKCMFVITQVLQRWLVMAFS